MSYFLSIKNDRVQIDRDIGGGSYIVNSVEDFNEYLAREAKSSGCKVEDIEMMASSSMDFPEEFTSKPETIALAKALRPKGWGGLT